MRHDGKSVGMVGFRNLVQAPHDLIHHMILREMLLMHLSMSSPNGGVQAYPEAVESWAVWNSIHVECP
jgi:hypothetical protein